MAHLESERKQAHQKYKGTVRDNKILWLPRLYVIGRVCSLEGQQLKGLCLEEGAWLSKLGVCAGSCVKVSVCAHVHAHSL